MVCALSCEAFALSREGRPFVRGRTLLRDIRRRKQRPYGRSSGATGFHNFYPVLAYE